MKNKETLESVVTLANAAELVNTIARGVIGNEVADTFNGSSLTRSVIYNHAMVRFQSAIGEKARNR